MREGNFLSAAAFVRALRVILSEEFSDLDWTLFEFLNTGGFNTCFKMKFTNNRGAVIRFPLPGAVMFPEEKVRSEASIMQYVLEKTSNKIPIPVPSIVRWVEAKESPSDLGPFIIMNYIHHMGSMGDLLEMPGRQRGQPPVLLRQWPSTPTPGNFGNSLFYPGPPSGNSAITKATESIVPPTVPSGAKVSNTEDEVWVSVWVGASSTAGDENANLYQPIFNWSLNQESQYVRFNEIPPYERKKIADHGYNIGVVPHPLMSAGQLGQPYVTVPKNTAVDFEIVVENKKVVQTVTMDGKVVSKESDALNSPLKYLYSSNECYTGSGNCGSLAGYYINNLTVTLSEADTKFDQVMALDGVTDDGFTTSDGGLTWHTEWVKVESVNFDSNSVESA
ncbi:hypothetical protein N7508_002899 [Penicillium antarcticum]|uniref:uncharacterized protein n=1 Tax=Penicillium antarcticum TaxID=416450 RepID=UPI0023A21F8A|nr:uncharacterized protein N7508_002899 [Penicillium antarcticum]KAJ5312069.1 hypothetical protein N7508_002899 [Penicillium antarcticum]